MNPRYSFDGWTLDTASGELRRGQECVRLQEHPLQLLVALLERPGELISREALIARLWPKGVVEFDTGLNTAIRRLRVALADEAEQPKYIETLPRRGYRFIGHLGVAAARESAPAAQQPVASQPAVATPLTQGAVGPGVGAAAASMRRAWLLTSAGMLLIAAGLGWHLAQRPAAPQIRAIAVLPFVDMSEQHDQQYFADGMAEEIMDLLATVPALKVIGRTSSFSFRDNTSDLRRIGEQLGATYIVEGSVRRSGSRVRIGAQLVDSATGTSIWSGTMDREFHDVLALQQQIASEISRALQLAAGADFLHQERQPINAEAYNYYLRGRWAIDRGDDGVREAKTDFEQSLALDPTSVKATEGLALAYLEEVAGHLTASAVAWPAAEDAARRALALDPGSALAHALLGLGQVTYEYDWAGANQELDRALALHPHDPYALYIGAWLAFDLGRHKECIRLQEAALAIDPLNPDSLQNDAYIRYLLGDLKAAERGFKRSLEISPTYYSNHRMLGEILLKQGDPVAALAQMELEMTSGRDLGLALAYFANGRKQEADRALARVVQDLDQYGEVNVALAYAYRNERHEAFEWLQRAVASRDINLGHRLKYDWMFDTLRSDPRYHALLKQMHYPE